MNQKTMSIALAALIPLAALVYCGCKSDTDNTPAEEMGKTVEPTDPATTTQPTDEGFQQERSEYVQKMNQEINQINNEIDSLASRMDAMSEDAKAKTQESINNLQEKRDKVKASLERIQNASSEVWNDVKQSFQRDMADLRSNYNALLEDMKTDE